MSLAEDIKTPIPDFDQIAASALIEALKQRNDVTGIVAGCLSKADTFDLIGEIEDRVGEGRVQDFIDRHTVSDGDDCDEMHLRDAHTSEIADELTNRAGGGDMLARDIITDFQVHAFDFDPQGKPPRLEGGRLIIEAGALTQALEAVSAVIERRNTLPILGMARFQSSDSYFSITGTDLDIEITADWIAPGDGQAMGLCIAPHALLALVRRLAGDELVTIGPHPEALEAHVTWASGEMFLPAMPVEDFPAFTMDTDLVEARDCAGIIDALDRVRHAISTEETRYYLNGVCFSRDGGANVVVATDGHRLTAMPVNVPDALCEKRAIIPTKTVDLWRKLFRGGAYHFAVGPTRAHVAGRGLTMRSKLIDGDFPEYMRVMGATKGEHFAEFSRTALLEAAESIIPFSSERSRAIRLAGSDGRLTATVHNPDHGKITIYADDLVGDLLSASIVGLNGNYLIDALENARGERVRFRSTENPSEISGPIAVESLAPSAAGEVFMLMPLRV